MIRKLAVVAAVIAAGSLGIAGCSSDSAKNEQNNEAAAPSVTTMKPADGAADKTAEKPAGKPVNLRGNWASAATNGSKFEATISDKTIEIWVTETDTADKFLYWAGTVEEPTEPGEFTWTSKADKQRLAASMLGSQSDVKEFTVKNDQIFFQFTGLGNTTEIQLRRVER